MPRNPSPRDPEQVADTANHVGELLEVLWGRAQEKAPSGPIPPSQLRALKLIEEQGSVNQRTLGEVLGTGPSSVSRLCDRLEAAGLLERVPSATSRREVELTLSAQGEKVLDELRLARTREVAEVLRTMAPSHLGMLSEGLERLRQAATVHVGLERPAADDTSAIA
ncbi:MarR family winged helix-turn-helix transcriptional regulator [Streptomyces sp. NPDC051684]|uniref:MarR family winged helix-turn-helix transcriptional regulator n=1 Tax=Streptomyces sp. NPDC051684 TaxID=3365670 RepID=UPI0037AF590D